VPNHKLFRIIVAVLSTEPMPFKSNS